MERVKLTKELIFKTFDEVGAEKGGEPTLEEVRQRIGGSLSTLGPAKKEWLTSRKAAATAPVIRESAPDGIVSRMTDMAGEIWTIARDLANERLAEDKKTLDAKSAQMERDAQEAAELSAGVERERDVFEVELTELRPQIAQLREDNAQLTGTVRTQDAEIKSLQADLRKERDRAAAAEKEAAVSNTQLARLEADGRVMREQLDAANEATHAARHETLNAERRATEAATQADERQKQIETYKGTVRDLEAQLRDLQGRNVKSEAEVSAAKATAEERGNRMAELQRQLSEMSASAAQAAEKAADDLRAHYAAASSANARADQLQQQVAQLTAQLDSSKSKPVGEAT